MNHSLHSSLFLSPPSFLPSPPSFFPFLSPSPSGRAQELLPDSPPYFDKDQLTDKPARFFVSEIIREKILLYYDKEIPYSVEVSVESFKETERNILISTGWFGTSMSARHILGLEKVPRVGRPSYVQAL